METSFAPGNKITFEVAPTRTPFFLYSLLGARCGDFACESAYEHGHKTPIERRKNILEHTIAFGEILIPIYMLMKIYGPLEE
jgi:hypothetical protein